MINIQKVEKEIKISITTLMNPTHRLNWVFGVMSQLLPMLGIANLSAPNGFMLAYSWLLHHSSQSYLLWAWANYFIVTQSFSFKSDVNGPKAKSYCEYVFVFMVFRGINRYT